jgi:hypothetical protein
MLVDRRKFLAPAGIELRIVPPTGKEGREKEY